MSEQGLERVEVLRAEVAHEVARASSLVIASPADFTAAGEFLKAVKAAQNRVTAHFAGMKAAAHAAWKAVTTQEADTLKPLAEAEAVVKRRMLDYHAEQERIRIAEERRLQAEADKALRDPAFMEIIRTAGGEPIGGSSADFETRIRRDRERLGEVIRSAGIKAQ